jgi:EAL domain-containing protein (putative c-di-GMP-specific phosphodiesterase class I)
MIDASDISQSQIVQFGRRGPPRACVLDHKPHVRAFLAGMLDELGFLARDCAMPQFKGLLSDFMPNLLVLGPLNGTGEVALILHTLKFIRFHGRVMLFGGRHSMALMQMQEVGEQAGLDMLSPLGTPFRDGNLRDIVSCFLPIAPSPNIPIDVEEAMQNGWLEMWYQPKIDPRSLAPDGAEAIVRVRHPNWGLISPSSFVAGESDPHFHRLTQFVILRAMADSTALAAASHPIDISVNLPVSALEDADFVDRVLRAIPEPALKRLQIELRCSDVVDDVPRIQRIAARLAFRNIGIAIDDIGPEGMALAGRHDLPVVEMKVGTKYVHGCATDKLKQAVCSEIVTTAKKCGARSVAEGVDTQADYLAARELGFDLLQGALFGKPMEPDKFERTMLLRGTASRAAR